MFVTANGTSHGFEYHRYAPTLYDACLIRQDGTQFYTDPLVAVTVAEAEAEAEAASALTVKLACHLMSYLHHPGARQDVRPTADLGIACQCC
jgi:hypothetical protein